MRKTVYFFISLLSIAPALAESPNSFGSAKKLLADIHEDIGHQITVYCGCPYKRTTKSGGDLDREVCGLKARKNESRSDRLEWEHVVPAARFGNTRTCWTTGHAKCVKRDGTKYKGRKCCNRSGVDKEFRMAHNDPINLFPSGGEVNGDRSDHPYGQVPGEDRVFGSCDFEVGGSPKRAEYSDGVKGEIARAILHMIDHRGAMVPYDRAKLELDSANDPPEAWEIERATKITEETGVRNKWVLGAE